MVKSKSYHHYSQPTLISHNFPQPSEGNNPPIQQNNNSKLAVDPLLAISQLLLELKDNPMLANNNIQIDSSFLIDQPKILFGNGNSPQVSD